MSLQNKIAIVTGASRGIGRAIATQLGKQNATMIGTATSQQGADAISAYFEQAGIQGRGLVLNISQRDSMDAFVETVQSEVGQAAILVNNAGITRDNIMLRIKDQEWDDIIQTNLSSVYYLSKKFLKGMIKARWGRIISISSVVGAIGNIGQANYAAAKAGVIGFSKSLAREIATRNITVNVVAPGFIETDMTNNLTDDMKAALLATVPMQRLGSADEIASATAFLASPAADYITGQTLHVNGGMFMN